MNLISILIIIFLALVSPGPDFAIVVKNSLVYSRRLGIFTALGVALSNVFHASYILGGFGVIISSNFWIFWIVKFLGASYLIYIGIKNLMSKKSNNFQISKENLQEFSMRKAVVSGFLNSAFNPKAMLFYMSLFSVLITNDINKTQIISYITVIFIEAFLWFSLVAICFSNTIIRNKFISIAHWIERVTGLILIAFGIKLIFTKIK